MGVRYTRKGIFSLTSTGTLVTDRGDFVLSRKGAVPEGDIQSRLIKLRPGRVSITPSGDIFVNGKKKGQISILEFNDVHALKKEGGSNFINPNNGNLKTDPPTTRLQQGFIEESNVNAISEMSELIKANRHFESLQKVIKAYDNITGKAINEIAKF